MISPKHKSVFVHIPKVAGQSIESVFLDDLGLNWQERGVLLMRKKEKSEKGPFRLAHLRAEDYVGLGYMEAEDFKDFFKFSFVRNPYSRVISLYTYLGYSRIISLDIFIKKILKSKIAEKHFFFLPQYDYLYDMNGNLLVDFVGKLERINEDMNFVFQNVNMKTRKLPHINKSIKGVKRGLTSLLTQPSILPYFRPKLLFSKKKKPELTEDQKEAIFNLYIKDFDTFSYDR